MPEETVVAIFDSAAFAQAAIRDLRASGLPESAITQHALEGRPAETTHRDAGSAPEPGFWSSLFGGEPDDEQDATVFDRSLADGATVVTVKAASEHLTAVSEILERHDPVDLEERAAAYGDATPGTARTDAPARSDATPIPLAEEQLSVAKRTVSRGTTRVRRYVVETPVEQQVTLRDETISVERRPASGKRAASDPTFTETVIEVAQRGEEAVVSKAAHVHEEVVLHKDASERTETIRETLRREDIEVSKADIERSTSRGAGLGAPPASKRPAL